MRGVLAGLVLVIAAIGCTSAPGTSTPSPGATGSWPPPTASPTASPTAPPTASPTFGGDQISHPTAPTEVVLQMEQGGGFVPIEFMITQAPSFSLYGDGTLIFRPTDDPGPVGGVSLGPPRFVQVQLSEEHIQALLRFALGQGRLLDARDHYAQNMCADCPTTIFTLSAADMSKTVAVDALSEIEAAGPDAVDRRGFAQLAQTLNGFEQRARAGELGEVTLYDPQLYRVVLMEAQPGQGEAVAWPWPDLTVDDFPVEGDGFRRVAVLSRELVAMVVEVPTGGVGSIVVEAPNDVLWTIGIRPLLPNEIPADPPLG